MILWRIVINSAELGTAPCLVSFSLLNKEVSRKEYITEISQPRDIGCLENIGKPPDIKVNHKNRVARGEWAQLCNMFQTAHCHIFVIFFRTGSIYVVYSVQWTMSSRHNGFKWIFLDFLPLFQSPPAPS